MSTPDEHLRAAFGRGDEENLKWQLEHPVVGAREKQLVRWAFNPKESEATISTTSRSAAGARYTRWRPGGIVRGDCARTASFSVASSTLRPMSSVFQSKPAWLDFTALSVA